MTRKTKKHFFVEWVIFTLLYGYTLSRFNYSFRLAAFYFQLIARCSTAKDTTKDNLKKEGFFFQLTPTIPC